VPIREALKVLHAQGILAGGGHRGYRVASFEPATIERVFELRLMLETYLLRDAVQRWRAGEADPGELDVAIRQMEMAAKAGDASMSLRADLDFHRTIARAAGNPIAATLWEAIARHVLVIFSLEPYRDNEFYKSEEEFVFAIAEAMRTEYETIAKAGFLLQVDDAWLPALWDRIGIQMGLEAFRKRCMMRVEALNHALRDIPQEQIRYHLCWGSWHGPHAYDIEMIHMVDIMLSVKAQAYLFEAANARHEHEHAVWETVRLPAGKIVVPGVVTHSTDVVEHPELVSQRIQRFAKLVGKENVMAGADCGFGGRSHPQLAWAKLRSLVEGAERATKALRFL
jgi:hypothetical protein